MTKLKYCKKCILPSTRPNLHLNAQGICSGCNSTEVKAVINWNERKKYNYQVIM